MTFPFETARLDALRKLAAERFGEISPAEEGVLRLSARAEDVETPETKDRREVRAAFLRWLATDKDAAAHVDPLGLRVENATVDSALDLNYCMISLPLRFSRCILNGDLDLNSAEVPALSLIGCKTEHGIFAEGLRMQSSITLHELECTGEIRLLGAQIGGNLDCSGATLTATGKALSADRANITGSVFLRGGFSCAGTIRLLGAQIGGDLACSGAALTAMGDALTADGAGITGSIFLKGGFSCSGGIRFLGAQIGGDLDCSGATLTEKGNALSADGAKITGNAFLREGFCCLGRIGLPGTLIGGCLDCSDATLTAVGDALIADRANITGSVFLNKGFSCSGEIRLHNAQIGGDLDCSGATLTAKDDALSANRANITGGVFLNKGFSCSGEVRFLGAFIGGDLACAGARIGDLCCEHMRLEGNLIWTAIRAPEKSFLNLFGASINKLSDDAASLPARGNLIVKGLEYRDLIQHEPTTEEHLSAEQMAPQRTFSARERICWLNLQDEEVRTDPHAWMWLAKLFKEKDDIAGYRQVLCEYRCMKARGSRNRIARLVGVGMAHLERSPWHILWLFMPLLLLGTLIFWWEANAGNIPPTSAEAHAAWAIGKPFPIAYPRFNPLVYTLENELPLVKFGMDDKWAPDPNLTVSGRAAEYWGLAGFRWFLIFAGWVQGILLTLGISRRFRD